VVLTARLPAEHNPEVNTSFTVDVDMGKVHLFDTNTERSILD
jgi:hypothetical protein